MTYIIDLHRLWEERANTTSENQKIPPSMRFDPRKNKVSAVIVVYSDKGELLNTLQSVLNQHYIREVIIVVCADFPDLEKSLSKFVAHHPRCYLVTGRSEMGLAAAYNLGAQYASGSFLLFWGAACVLPPNAVSKMLEIGMHKPGPWVVGIKNTALKNTWKMQLKKGLRGYRFFEKLTRTQYESASYPDSFPQVSLMGGGIHVLSVAPQCLFLPSATFWDLKGMDKNCFQATFHLDLCLRIHLAGGGVYYANGIQAALEWDPPVSFPKMVRQEWQFFRGWCHFYRKYVSKFTNIVTMNLLYMLLTVRLLSNLCLRTLFFQVTNKFPLLSKQTPLDATLEI